MLVKRKFVLVEHSATTHSKSLRCNTIYSYSKGKTRIFFVIYPASLKYSWMYHSGSKEFYPTSCATHRTFFSFYLSSSTTDLATHIYLSAWLGKWEDTRTESQLCFFSEKLFHNRIKRPFKISKCHSFSHNQSLELIKITGMSCVFLFVPEYSSRNYYFYWELLAHHSSDLHRRGMCS